MRDMQFTTVESHEALKWALSEGLLSPEQQSVLNAYVTARRNSYRDVSEWCLEKVREMRSEANACTPDQSTKREILTHKADKLDNVIERIWAMERGEY